MPTVNVSGIQVSFPYEPYECQVTYMEKVVEGLKKYQNAILESPTGTGKTLCLLCSSLAWLENKKAQIGNLALKNSLSIEDGGNSGSSNGRDGDQSGGYSNNKGRNGGGNTWGSGACIDEDVWLGYNHKTASQKGGKSFKEQMLKKLNEAAGHWGGETNFPKILYASRTHSQLNQAIQELKKTAYKYMKVSIVGSRDQLCIHPVVSKEKNSINKVYMCKNKVKNRSCHYYNNVEAYKSHAQNEVMDIEDLLACGKKNNVCPYYLAREMKDDADVVFTPYNYILDPKSRKAQGLDLSGNILIFDEAHNLGGICEESHSFELSNLDIATALSDLQSIITQVSEHQDSDKPFSDVNDSWVEDTFSHSGNNKQDFTLDDALRLKKILLELEEKLDAMPLSSEQVQAQSGSVMLQIFRDLGIDDHSKSSVQDAIDKMALSLNATSNAFSSKGLGLSKISDVLEIMFGDQGRRDMCHVASDFKVHIRAVEQKKNSDDFTAPSASKISRVLSYWCFNPGYTMTDLQRKGARMLILTSGTLSPINSFVSEFAVNFPIRLENPHVIDSKQVLIACLENGPDNVALNSSYKNRSNKEYLTSLGNTLVNFTRIVPRGFLVFFPSYGIMQQSIDFWHISGIYHRIEAKKQIFVEPKSKIELLEEMTNFYTRVNNPDYDGAVFMAVCRGKVSEGLDFADNNGRAVVITGLPFPPMFDAKVKLKMDFLTQKKTKGGMGGQEWYELQASRAVNQAIGRVIRHRNDFGAILLCDNRFSRSTHHLPRWLRSEVKKFNKFGALQRELMLFFKPHHHNVKELLYKTTEPKTSAAPHSTITHIPPNPHKRLRLEPSSAISDHSANQADLLSVYGDCGEPIEKCLKDDQGNKLFNALESMQKNFEKNPVKSSQNTSKQNIFKKTSKEPLKKLLIEGSTYNTNTFIDRLKDNMTLQDYDAFKRVLNVYKTEHNLAPLIHFLQDNISAPQYRFIAIGMSQLVRSVDREEFHNSFHITQADFRQACDVIDQDAKEQSIWDVNTQEIKVGNMRIKDFLVTNTITASATTTTNTNTLNNNNNNNNINNKNNNKNNDNTNNNNNNNSINSNNDNNNNNNNKDNNNNNNNNKTISTSKHYFSSKKSKVKVNNPSIRMFFSKESTVIGSVPPRVNNNNHNNNNNNKNHKDNNKNSKNINNKTDNKGNYENTNNNNFNNKNINNINVNNIDKKDNNSNNENITNVNNNKNDNDKTNNNNNKCTHTRMHPLMGRCKGCGEERCNICWQDISKNGKYCPKCGTRVKKSNIIYH